MCHKQHKIDLIQLFDEATNNYGIPSSSHTDKGGENVLIWDRMLELSGPDRRSYQNVRVMGT